MKQTKEIWEPMQLTEVGRVNELVLRGVAKTGGTAGDPGEPGKVPALDMG